MNASVPIATEESPTQPARRQRLRRAATVAGFVLGGLCALLLVLWLILLITPIRLPFGAAAARSVASSVLPPTANVQLGEMALALEGGMWPVIQFSPVALSDSKTGAHITMEALEIGFSPLRALFGQPGASITMVGPRIQIVQDLFGPRATRFELVENPDGGPATVRVLEGQDAFPSIGITAEGVELDGALPSGLETALRSDNDWLIYNLEASEKAMADVVEQAALGRFSRLVIRDGVIEMNDSVYGLFRRFTDISLDIAPDPGGQVTQGTFSATLGGRTMTGSVSRAVDEDGNPRLEADITNIDFSSFLPFIDDPASVLAVRGAGAISIDVAFSGETGKPTGGLFKVDMTGLDLRIKDDFFPIVSSILDISWTPETGRFTLEEGAIGIGQSSARIAGVFALGLDRTYGPTIGISMSARDIVLHPSDMEAPAEPFDHMEFSGWSAPLYGALGIDKMRVTKGEAWMQTTGRVDMLRAGIGFDIAVSGQGISADDLKRLWPYIMGRESRDWFVANITQGTVAESSMRFTFPVGSVAIGEEDDRPLPQDSMYVDIVGTNVAIKPTAQMAPIEIGGDMVLRLRDSDLSVSAAGGEIPTAAGPIRVSSPALVMEETASGRSVFEISGDIEAGIPAILALAREQQPQALAAAELPIDPAALSGNVDMGILATIKLADEAAGLPMQLDYVLNGSVADFASSEPIQEHSIGNGQLMFSASQAGYQVAGQAEVDGMEANIAIEGTPETAPVFQLSSTVAVADLAEMGFDASEFLSGEARFAAQPMPDGTLQIIIDLEQAGLTISDLGISKAVGTPGTLRAVIEQDGDLTQLRDIDLTFADVHLAGSLEFHAENGLQSAELTTFQLSPGDSARVSLAPLDSGGYAITMRGEQLDLKPMLRRFFGLGEGSGGVETTQFDEALVLDIELERAVGFYRTTAFNVDLDLALDGSDLTRANVSASFSESNALAVTTNRTPEGRIMSVAFNDAGTILRLLGVYSQLAGGQGSLVLNRNAEADVEYGELQLENFAIVDEANVAQILGNHSDSRELIARQNRLDFESGRVTFTRSDDRVEVTEGVLSGDMVGGTMRGFIYTDERQYDLTGTYVPLFGLNNAFQQIPLFGPLLGGRDGEGLVGVTFAVRGPLDDPQFRVNPLSALVPGAFRELFEFRAQGEPVPVPTPAE